MKRLYFHYVSLNVRSMMQYKTSFFLTVLGQFLVSFQIFLGIFVMFQRFSNVEGFTYSQVLLCFSIMLLEFSLAEMFARGFDSFSSLVRSGEFDRILVRPQNEILQVLGSRFELTRAGRLLQAVVMFVYGILESEIAWDPLKILTVIFMLIGGIAVFTGLFMIYAGLCFLHAGRAGVYEHLYGRSEGIREIPDGRVWKKDPAVFYFYRSLRMDPILPVPLSSGTEGFGLVRGPAAWGVLVFDSRLAFMADGGKALPIQRIIGCRIRETQTRRWSVRLRSRRRIPCGGRQGWC